MHLICISFHLYFILLLTYVVFVFTLITYYKCFYISCDYIFHVFIALDDLVARLTICEWPLRP